MKNQLFTLLILSISVNVFSDELSWVDKQVQAIKPPRDGMKRSQLANIKNPFIFFKNKDASKDEKTVDKKAIKTVVRNSKVEIIKPIKKLSLKLIMNNAAMISGEWYKVGDSINGYKVNQINKTSVLLVKNKKKLLLSTKSNSKTLKFHK